MQNPVSINSVGIKEKARSFVTVSASALPKKLSWLFVRVSLQVLLLGFLAASLYFCSPTHTSSQPVFAFNPR